MDFITWFKGSLEDDTHTASFKRIYNWIIICLVVFVVIYVTLNRLWSNSTLWALSILLVAGFLNTGVITTENILRFKNGGAAPAPEPPTPEEVAESLEIKAK